MGDPKSLFRSGMSCCDLSNYFTQDQLDNMPVFEKMIKFNKMKNYFVCQSLNLSCELPEFMKTTLKEMGAVVEGSLNDPTKLSEEVKRMLLCTDIPLSYYTSARPAEDNFIGGKINLPLCKNKEFIKQIWDNLCWIAPTAIKEMEEDYKMRKRALELFKNHKLGANELQLFFPTSLELLENALDNLSLQKDKKCNEPRYAFRKVAKKDYCEVESDESDKDSIAEAQLLESVQELSDVISSTRDINSEDNYCSPTSRESPVPLKWNLPNSFAAKTLPDGLVLKCSNFPNAVLGIFTRREFKKDSIFGPYVGIRVYNNITNVSGRVWEIFVDGYLHHYIDGEDPQQSNWMRYINHANSPDIQNMESFQYRYKIYYRTTKDVPADTELMVWYSNDYNQDYDESQKKTKKAAYSPKTNADNTKKPIARRSVLKARTFNLENIGCNKNSGTTTIGEADVTPATKDAANCSTKPGTLKAVSTAEGRHRCDVCGSTFNQTCHLKTHMRIHTGEKPYKCDVCGSTFNKTCNLKTHMRIHTGEKPYKCDVCGSTFNQTCNLKTHMRIHTGEKPYKCDVCGSTFNLNSSLKTHMRIHVNSETTRA